MAAHSNETQSPAANGSRLLWSLLALWVLTFAGSFIAYALIEPTGSSFTRGMNRARAFLGWQAAALGCAVALWWRARRETLSRRKHWIMRLPILIELSLLAVFVCLIGWGIWAGGRASL